MAQRHADRAEASCNSCFFTSEFPGADIGQDGVCSYCSKQDFLRRKRAQTFKSLEELQKVAERLKARRKGKYDCLVGASGGLDSSYVLYVAKTMLGLNPLAVKFDHGFNYDLANENIVNLCKTLEIDLRVYRSRGGHDFQYVREMVQALRPLGLYWGICKFCHYILPCVAYREAVRENISSVLVSSNLYEEHLKVPFRHKLKKMLRATLRIRPWEYPGVVWHVLRAQYFLLKLKQEFYLPPATNLVPMTVHPKNPGLDLINITDYVEWDVPAMVKDLTEKAGWRPPEAPKLPMRFDCMIENSFINSTFEEVAGITVHGIICNNLLHDGVYSREEMARALAEYSREIEPVTREVEKKLDPGA